MQALPRQPYFAGVRRAVAALEELGAPLLVEDAAALRRLESTRQADAVEAAERLLGRYTIARVELDEFGYARTRPGGAEPVLIEHGWRLFLVRVENPYHLQERLLVSGTTVPGITSNMAPANISGPFTLSQKASLVDRQNKAAFLEELWLSTEIHGASPLSGFDVEYRVLQLFSRDHGARSAYLSFSLVDDADALTEGRQGTEVLFDCLPSRDIALSILDDDGLGCVASLEIRDLHGRVYPPQAMRIAPDMRFHPQIYRGDGETVRLPDGDYDISFWRGPEYLRTRSRVSVSADSAEFRVRLVRWIDPAKFGWYAGETHIHAAGCAHYEVPTEGVGPETMIRQVRGEGLSVGNILTWGPGYYHQRQFFTGQAISPVAALEEPALQVANNARWTPTVTDKDSESVIRYDLEVSGFPSSHSGHLVLLRLQDQDYPGTNKIEDWPSWNLPILQWAKANGALAGFAHCAVGMAVDSTSLPNYLIPKFNGIGTNEAIIDVTFGAVDFLSGCEVLPAYELNAWYHMLNCGYRVAMVGETDYPCITDDRPGLGRSYVELEERPTGNAGYEAWIDGLGGNSYFGDGRSHFFDLRVRDRELSGHEVRLDAKGDVTVTASIAAWLEPEITAETDSVRSSPAFVKPVWHLERARLDDSREVFVEVVVNGEAADRQRILADGSPVDVAFDLTIDTSSWVALRILPSGHTQPIFVTVDDQPVRASEESARWCGDCVDKIWQVKSPFIRESELDEARRAYDHARRAYSTIAAECRALRDASPS